MSNESNNPPETLSTPGGRGQGEEGETNLPKAILFDLDETLIAFRDQGSALTQVAQEFAEPLAPIAAEEAAQAILAAFHAFWGIPANGQEWGSRILAARAHIVAGVFREWQIPTLTDSLAEAFAERFFEVWELQEASLTPGAHEVLDALKARGVRLALITNGDKRAQRAKLRHFGLEDRFDHIQIQGESEFSKPDARSYQQAMEALGVISRETWIVGDHLEYEVAAPQRLGIAALWYNPAGKEIPPDKPVTPDRILRSLGELIPDPSVSESSR